MSTNTQLVSQAFEDLGVLRPDGTLSSPLETQGLAALDRIYHKIGEFDVGYPWIDYVGEDGYIAGEDERVRIATAVTITYPDHVELDGTGTDDTFDEDLHRPPLDGARIQVVTQSTGANVLKFYRADRGAWVEATATAADQCPFGEGMEDYLIAMLAVRLSVKHPNGLQPETKSMAAQGWRAFTARYSRPSAPVEATFY